MQHAGSVSNKKCVIWMARINGYKDSVQDGHVHYKSYETTPHVRPPVGFIWNAVVG